LEISKILYIDQSSSLSVQFSHVRNKSSLGINPLLHTVCSQRTKVNGRIFLKIQVEKKKFQFKMDLEGSIFYNLFKFCSNIVYLQIYSCANFDHFKI